MRIIVVGDRAKTKLLLYALYLHDAFVQPLQMLLRPSLPIAECFSSDRHEGGAEERRIRNNGSTEKKKLVRTSNDEGGIAKASAHSYPIE